MLQQANQKMSASNLNLLNAIYSSSEQEVKNLLGNKDNCLFEHRDGENVETFFKKIENLELRFRRFLHIKRVLEEAVKFFA